MRKTFLLLSLLAGASPALAATYYLAADGDDSRTAAQAQNPATPWQSLARLNATMSQLQPGDNVLFRRGDVFRGALLITRAGRSGAPLTFGAYGSGAAPVLSGTVPLAGWVSVAPNVWEAPCPSCGSDVTTVATNGRILPLGRYPNLSDPNKGYLLVDSHSGSAFTSAQLAANPANWTGGEAVMRTERWVLDRAAITGRNANTLALAAVSRYGIKDKWGFFIQNHPAALDQPGEWCYLPATRKVRLYGRVAPAPNAVEAAVAPAVVRLKGQPFVTLENLTLAFGLTYNLDVESASNFTARGLTLLGAGENGLRLNGTGTGILVENCLINHSNNNSVNVSGYRDVTFRGNTIKNSGVVAGRGRSSDQQYFAFDITSCDQVVVENNQLDSCGYVGLSYYFANDITIRNNVIRHFDLVKDDGGGIYSWNGGNPPRPTGNARILDNLVMDAVGAPEGTNNPNYVPGEGIYLDDCVMNVEVAGNTVVRCRSSGIFLHGNAHVDVHDNTLVDNNRQLLLAPSTFSCAFTDVQVHDNVFFSTDAANTLGEYGAGPADLATLGVFKNNYYARPFDDLLTISVNRGYTLAEWQTAFRQDAGSRSSPRTFRPYRVDARTGPNLIANGDATTSTSEWSVFSPDGNGQLAWDNTNRLGSGGSLRLSFRSLSGQPRALLTAETRAGRVGAARQYTARFTAACSAGTRVVEVYFKRGSGDYTDLTPRTRVLLTPATTQYEVPLLPAVDDPTANLAFTMSETTQQVWLDNVRLEQATLTPATPADSIRFEYNPTATPQTVRLPAGTAYVDVRGQSYASTLTLAPFSSVVLLRDYKGRTITGPPAPARPEPPLVVVPNPAVGAATVRHAATAAGPVTLELLDAVGRRLQTRTVVVRLGPNELPLDLDALPPGCYFVRLTTAAGIRSTGPVLVGQ